jgi:hypothetical protein
MIGQHVVIATVATLLRDGRYRTEWSPLAFDLVVDIDTVRAPHLAGRDVVQYFVAPRLGFIPTSGRFLAFGDPVAFRRHDPRFREARQLRDTYAFFGCNPGEPTFSYDLSDAVCDPDSPLVLPSLEDARVAVSTSALAEKGWDQDLAERDAAFHLAVAQERIFTPARNAGLVRKFLSRAVDENGALGRSIVFALNHEHAVRLTRLINAELGESVAITITSRVENWEPLARAFAAGTLPYRIAVGVELLATGLHYRTVRNVAIMRPVFSAREYELLKGCAVYARSDGNSEPAKLLDFLGVAEYFHEGYTVQSEHRAVQRRMAALPRSTAGSLAEIREAFERRVRTLYEESPRFRVAVDGVKDDFVQRILEKEALGQAPCYSSLQVAVAYGVPASLPAIVYDILGKTKLPDEEAVVEETIAGLSARFDLRWDQERLLRELFTAVLNDKDELRKFLEGQASILAKPRFRKLGALRKMDIALLDAVRESPLFRVASLRMPAA